MVCGMDAMPSCIFNLCDVRMRIAITCKKLVSGGNFVRGKSVKGKLKTYQGHPKQT